MMAVICNSRFVFQTNHSLFIKEKNTFTESSKQEEGLRNYPRLAKNTRTCC